MAKIVNLSKYINKNLVTEPCSVNIYKIIYEVEKGQNISNITINTFFKNIVDDKEELIDLEIKFKNVTNFSLQDSSRIIIISGFEIIDHKEDGWTLENRFEINDFENGNIHFMCQEFKVKQL
ncbi:MAG: hypothetical protein HFJ41_02110 [Clostridia bacterium]|nr:hypothetical protein [Clostridia bacterium]